MAALCFRASRKIRELVCLNHPLEPLTLSYDFVGAFYGTYVVAWTGKAAGSSSTIIRPASIISGGVQRSTHGVIS